MLSHGHFDHVMGLQGLARRVGVRRMPIAAAPRLLDPPPARRPGAGARAAHAEPGRDRGRRLRRHRGARRPRSCWTACCWSPARSTAAPTSRPACRPRTRPGGTAAGQPDPLVHDDQAVVLHVRDKGLVVLTGCGHAGIVNIVRHARRRTGVDRVYAVLGGFHLRAGPGGRADRGRAGRRGPDRAGARPTAPAGRRSRHWPRRCPAAFHPNAVGSRFELAEPVLGASSRARASLRGRGRVRRGRARAGHAGRVQGRGDGRVQRPLHGELLARVAPAR